MITNMKKVPVRVSKPVSLLIRFLRSKFPSIRLKCWQYSKRFGEKITFRTPQGTFTVRTNDQAIAKALFLHGQYELDLIFKVKQLLVKLGYCANSDKSILIDVGANIGVISIAFLKDGFFKRAIAIEPEPENYDLLKENITLNGFLDQIHTFQNALSSVTGEVEFELSNDNFGDHRVKIKSENAASPDLFGEEVRKIITRRTRKHSLPAICNRHRPSLSSAR